RDTLSAVGVADRSAAIISAPRAP
ncbi:MAG: hypothetical protein QOE15_1984, partial [Acidimicrobiaceae bacterium]|nr:hypothetical protein [Acidimicrobiaceae bacterium]